MSVQREVFEQQSWANGATGAALTKTLTRRLHGRCEQIEVKINDNTGNRTLTLTVLSEIGGIFYTKAAIPENADTIYRANSQKAVQDADFNAFLADEKCTITAVLSSDPGTGGATADIAFWMADR